MKLPILQQWLVSEILIYFPLPVNVLRNLAANSYYDILLSNLTTKSYYEILQRNITTQSYSELLLRNLTGWG